MAAVRVALAVRVVLVDDHLAAGRQHPLGRDHRLADDLLGGLVEHHHLTGVGALGRRDLWVGVVDVVAGAVGEHGVDQVGLDVGRQGALGQEPPGVAAGRLVLEVPADPPGELGHVGVDRARTTRPSGWSRPTPRSKMPYSVSTPQTFRIATRGPYRPPGPPQGVGFCVLCGRTPAPPAMRSRRAGAPEGPGGHGPLVTPKGDDALRPVSQRFLTLIHEPATPAPDYRGVAHEHHPSRRSTTAPEVVAPVDRRATTHLSPSAPHDRRRAGLRRRRLHHRPGRGRTSCSSGAQLRQRPRHAPS